MPAINYEIKDLDLFTYDATKLFVDRDNRMFKLVQRNAEGFYDPSALFPDSAEIIFPNFVAKALTSFFGFEPCEVYDEDSEGNELGTIGYQLSNDNGSTWYYWDGAAWSSTTTDFNTKAEIDNNIDQFKLDINKQFKLKVKISASDDNLYTPRLGEIFVYTELDYDFEEDVFRTLKHHVQDNLNAKLKYKVKLKQGSAVVKLDVDLTVNSVISVYNLTDDPNKETDLYQSIDVSNNVTMTSEQDENDIIEINYYGTVPVFITSDKDYKTSEIPAIVIKSLGTTDVRERNFYGSNVIERNFAKFLTKTRKSPIWKRMKIRVECKSDSNLVTFSLVDSIEKILRNEDVLISEANGEELELEDYVPVVVDDNINLGQFGKIVQFDTIGKEWIGTPVQRPMVTKVKVGIIIDNKRVEEVQLDA